MKRLKNNLPDTVPFINSDFNDILQNQHQLAYSAWLDSINDAPATQSSTDSGIIIRGCEILFSDPIVDTNTGAINFDYKLRFKKTDLVYIDGQYYSPANSLTENPEVTISNVNQFYLVGVVTSNDNLDLVENRIRIFRDTQKKSFSRDYRFELRIQNFPEPQDNIKYIGFQWGGTSRRLKRLMKFTRSNTDDVQLLTTIPNKNAWDLSTKAPTLLFQNPPLNDYTQFNNLLLRDFDTTGLGRNEMQGFRLYHELSEKFMVGLSSSSSPSPVNAGPSQINYGRIGNIGGSNSIDLLASQIPNHDHGGKVLKSDPSELNHGHKLSALSHPSHLPSFSIGTIQDTYNFSGQSGIFVNVYKKYSKSSLIPGGPDVDITQVGGYLIDRKIYVNQEGTNLLNNVSVDFESKLINTLINQKWIDTYNSLDYNYLFGSIGKYFSSTSDGPQGAEDNIIVDRNLYKVIFSDVRSIPPPKSPNEPTGLRILSTSNWQDYLYWDKTLLAHRHPIDQAGDNLPHENRPPYYVVLYYTKI